MQQLLGIMIGGFLVCVIAGSVLARAAIASLDHTHKADLVTIVTKSSMWNLVAPLLTAAAYAVVVISNPQLLPVATAVALGILVAHGIFSAILAERAYRAHHFPARFLRLFRFSRGVRILGSAALFAAILVWLFGRDHA